MPEKNIVQNLYNELTEHNYDLPDYETFYFKMQSDTVRENFFNELSNNFELGDYESFSKKMVLSPAPQTYKLKAPTRGVIPAIKRGLEKSVPGLATKLIKEQEGFLPEPGQKSRFEDILESGTTLLADLPVFIAGGAIGTLGGGGPISGAAGAFGLPAGLRKTFLDKLEKGEVTGVQDFLTRLRGAAFETVKGQALGATVGAVSKVAPVGIKFPAEVGTLTAGGALLEGRLPTKKDFIDATILLGGLKGSSFLLKKLVNVTKKTGKSPQEIADELISKLPENTSLEKMAAELSKVTKESKPLIVPIRRKGKPVKVPVRIKEKPDLVKQAKQRELLNRLRLIRNRKDVDYENLRNRIIEGEKLQEIEDFKILPQETRMVEERAKAIARKKEKFDVTVEPKPETIITTEKKGKPIKKYQRRKLKTLELLKEEMPKVEKLSKKQAFGETLKGLNEIIKDLPVGLSTRDVRFKTGYEKAKPHFDRAWESYKEAGKSIKEFMEAMERNLESKSIPFLRKWEEDIRANIPRELQTPEDTVVRLTGLIKESKLELRGQTKERKQVLGQRFAVAKTILRKGIAEKDVEAVAKSRKALAGKLPTRTFETVRDQFTVEDVFKLHNMVYKKFPERRYTERANTVEALNRILDPEGLKLPRPFEIELLQKVYGKQFVAELLKKRSLGQKAWATFVDVWGLRKALLASADLSFSFRQGALLIGEPKPFFKALGTGAKAFFNKDYAKMVNEKLDNDPFADKRAEMGIHRSPLFGIGGRIGKREESFQTELAQYIPLVKRSERAFVISANQLRADVANKYIPEWEKIGKTPDQFRKLGEFINTATGRGELGKLEGSGAFLNAIAFSPRLQIGRVQAPLKILTRDPDLRKIVAKNLISFMGLGFITLGMAKLIWGGDVEKDPRSSGFAKLKHKNTRFDSWAGYQQLIRYFFQFLAGETKSTTGKVSKLNRLDVIGRFLRSKVSPNVGTIINFLQGKTFLGEDISIETGKNTAKKIANAVMEKEYRKGIELIAESQPWRELTFLFVQDMVDAALYSGLSGAALAAPAAVGFGSISYPESDYGKTLKYKDDTAKITFGRIWDDLTPHQQKLLRNDDKNINELERKSKVSRTSVYIDKSIQQQQDIAKNVQKQLHLNIQDELKLLEMKVTGLSRKLGNFRLNDERYKRYQELSVEYLNKSLSSKIKLPVWENTNVERKRNKMQEWITKSKAAARKQLIREINSDKL